MCVFSIADIFPDHFFIHLWVFLDKRHHLFRVQGRAEMALLLQVSDSLGWLGIKLLCAHVVHLNKYMKDYLIDIVLVWIMLNDIVLLLL